ncbi:MAG: hypothetical protein EPN25_02620 [Nitrospirae bacterium]|nr:MAG: hypothetical protein EPN25_02620 [Nitrospirota bacterium]
MKMVTSRLVPVVLVIMSLVLVLSSLAEAGRALRAAGGGSLEAQLGVRFNNQLPEDLKAGDTFEALVLDPAKLHSMGFNKMKRGTKISLKVVTGDGKFMITPVGQAGRNFHLNEQGRVNSIQ